ncbi:MAG: type II toxin-antitoxin system HicB family antitoxin [Coriobacteriia bacterium]
MKYIVRLEFDETRRWVASINDVPGCHTQGRSIRQVMSRAREALEVCVGDVADAELVPQIELPTQVREAVARYEGSRERLKREEADARTATRDAVRVLGDNAGLSVRDVGDVLGLSHQRVQQISRGQ